MSRLGLRNSLWKVLFWTALACLVLALVCAWVSNGFGALDGWASFAVAGALGAGLIWLAWGTLRQETAPRWLLWLVIGAALLRLAVSAFWIVSLPQIGYGSAVEKAGYVMKDAWTRDTAAWELAKKTNQPLWKAFTQSKWADQYGGLMFFSAVFYRFLGGQTHQPLLMIVLCAAVSSLAVFFTWGFTRRVWGRPAAALAAWIVALYPEAVLLGSSQMREAFLIPLVALAFFGVVYYDQTHARQGLVYVILAFFGSLLVSPPFAGMLLAGLLAFSLVLEGSQGGIRRLIRRKEFWLVSALVLLLVLAGLWLGWGQIAPKGVQTPWELLNWWARKVVAYQTHLSRQSSGWIQREFRRVPEGMQTPLVVMYGTLRPFLPAALAAFRTPLWYGISIWRALGWAAMLLSLVYATFHLLIQRFNGKKVNLALVICAIIWVSVLVASIRGGGDDWDNPRYRSIFVCLQAGLAAWAWREILQYSAVVVRRVLVAAGVFMFWFFIWYIRRY